MKYTVSFFCKRDAELPIILPEGKSITTSLQTIEFPDKEELFKALAIAEPQLSRVDIQGKINKSITPIDSPDYKEEDDDFHNPHSEPYYTNALDYNNDMLPMNVQKDKED